MLSAEDKKEKKLNFITPNSPGGLAASIGSFPSKTKCLRANSRELHCLAFQITTILKREKDTKEELKCTSVSCPFHVEPSLIRLKIFRSRFLGSIVQLADFAPNDKIVALTREFFFAHQIANSRPSHLCCFKSVASKKHSFNGFL